MPSVARELPVNYPRYTQAELMECRRNILRYARLFPPGPQRDQHRRIASSLQTLFRNAKWLNTHTLLRGSAIDLTGICVAEGVKSRP
jgi:hypothetical protein